MNYTNIRMVEQNSILTAEMKELAKQNAEQTEQGGRQAQSMAILAYDAKRDSEVMKAITIVTLVFLPATFVSVRPILCLELSTYPYLFSRQSSVWVYLISLRTSSCSLGKVGSIWLARARSLSSSSERHLGGYGGQGRRKRSLTITLLVKRLHKPPVH